MAKATKNQVNRAQRTRFIEAARAAECSEHEAVFDRAIKHIVKAPPKRDKPKPVKRRKPKTKE